MERRGDKPTDAPQILLKWHREKVEDAKARKGEKPKDKYSRAMLLALFARGLGPQMANHSDIPGGKDAMSTTNALNRQRAFGPAYPPCSLPMTALKPMAIGELQLETVHRGRVLIVRTIGEAWHVRAATNAVEDFNGDVDQLEVHFTDYNLSAMDILPRGEVFAIKEPYYKIDVNQGYSICVDHPSDLLHLQEHAFKISEEFRSQAFKSDSAENWKDKGNVAFKARNFNEAIRCYTLGLQACDEIEKDSLLKFVLHRNRAQANFRLSRYRNVLQDIQSAVIPEDAGQISNDDRRSNNIKAMYRAGEASYYLQDYPCSKLSFEKVLELAPGDPDARRGLKRIKERVEEQAHGTYNFLAMAKGQERAQKRVDAANFLRKTASRPSALHGRGLFAVEAIELGDLIICEKATAASFFDDPMATHTLVVDTNNGLWSDGCHVSTLANAVQALLYDHVLAEQFALLHDGGYSPKTPTKVNDGLVPVDTFRAQAVLALNSFTCTPKLSGKVDGSIGIWLQASTINHDCIGNASRSFIGDMMVVRATRNIAKDEEILFPYSFQRPDHEAFQTYLQRSFGFACRCTLCIAEAKVSPLNRKQRIEKRIEVTKLIEAHPLLRQQPPPAAIRKAEKLYKDIEATYADTHSPFLPRITLGEPLGFWLCWAYTYNHSGPKIRKTALRMLRDFGYDVSLNAGKLSIDRVHPRPCYNVVSGAIYAAVTWEKEGLKEVAEQMVEFAKEIFTIDFGCLHEFEKRFGSDSACQKDVRRAYG